MSLLIKLGLYVALPAIVLLGSGWCIYTKGSEQGAAVVQKKFDDYRQARSQAEQKLKDGYVNRERDHATDSQKAADALQQASEAHATELVAVRTDLTHQLLVSESRAAIYQREARGGATECAGLASHTAELDRSLVEGQSVVRELIATINLRDGQLVQVGNQLLADRKLFADSPIPDTKNDAAANANH